MDLADTDTFRKLNIGLLRRIDAKLGELITLIQGTETEVVITEEQLKDAREHFGTTD